MQQAYLERNGNPCEAPSVAEIALDLRFNDPIRRRMTPLIQGAVEKFINLPLLNGFYREASSGEIETGVQ